jgi:hypothetical protein
MLIYIYIYICPEQKCRKGAKNDAKLSKAKVTTPIHLSHPPAQTPMPSSKEKKNT